MVLLSDNCDPDEIATYLAEAYIGLKSELFQSPDASPDDIILSLKVKDP